MRSTFNRKKYPFSNVIPFYLASNNSANILIWNILFISTLMVCKVSVGDQSFPHPPTVRFMSTTEMTHTPRGPPGSPTLTCGSSTQASVSDLLPSTGGQLSAQGRHSWSRTQAQTHSSLSPADNTVMKSVPLTLLSLELHNRVIFNTFLLQNIFRSLPFNAYSWNAFQDLTVPSLDNHHPFMTLTILILYTFCISQKTKQYPLWQTSM